MLAEAIIAYLLTVPELMAYVGNGDSPLTCRIFPIRLPQSYESPAIIYRQISAVRDRTHQGSTARNTVRMQYNSYSETYEEARAISDELRRALDDFQGLMGTVQIFNSAIENDNDFYLDDTRVYYTTTDFMITFNET